MSTADRSRYSPADVERNTVIRHLHENGPATSRELPADVSGRAREVVARLSPLRTGGNGRKSRLTSPSMTVYYLYGDERRAVRKYIAEHTPAIRSCFEDHNSPLQQNLEDIIYQMFIEEWGVGEWS
ncbi:MAG: hypothetical protein U5J98_06825 [Halobacteriales archaeon]|nr:hypothetical protein [Halobacteriales archaeon]